jgi:putative salt-induced outer membrane protein YdiY
MTIILLPATTNSLSTLTTNSLPKKKPRWESSAEAGLTLTRGNSDTLLTTARAVTGKKWEKNQLNLGADGAYGENKNQSGGQTTKSAETGHAFGQYDRLFTGRLYGYGRADSFHDGVADIEYRVALGPGVGYYLIKTKPTQLSVEFGPGYVFEDKGGQQASYATLRLAERFDLKLNDHARIWQSVECLPEVQDFGNYILNAEAGIESSLTKTLSLRTYVLDTFSSHPAAGRLKNDMKLIAAIAVRF